MVDDTPGATSLGTTIVGIVADGGNGETEGVDADAPIGADGEAPGGDAVVLAADRRASLGRMVSSKDAEKVHPVGGRAALAFTGSVSGAQALVADLDAERRLYELRRGKEMAVTALAGYAATIMRQRPYGVQHLLGGVDDDGARLFTFDAGGSILRQPFAADGSGGPFAYGTLEAGYEPGMGVADARALAARAVAAASERDTASGNGLQVVTVTADGVASTVVDDATDYDATDYDDPAAVAG